MAATYSVCLAMAGCLLGGAATACLAQRGYTPPPPQLTTLPPCPVPKDTKDAKKIAKRKDCDPTNRPVAAVPQASAPAAGSAAEQFPFPGEQPAKTADAPAAKAFPYSGEERTPTPSGTPNSAPGTAEKRYPHPGDPGGGAAPASDSDIPHDPAAETKAQQTPAGKAFPYPGEAAGSNPAPDTASRSTPDSSSSSSSSSSSDDDATPGKPSEAKGSANDDDDDGSQPKLTDRGSEGKRNKKTIKPQTDDERVDEDLSVARFYGKSGNSMGAYLRAKDAVKTEPDYAEAHFMLAEAARRLNKRDEAKAEFSAYLKLSPDGESAKSAEKALEELH